MASKRPQTLPNKLLAPKSPKLRSTFKMQHDSIGSLDDDSTESLGILPEQMWVSSGPEVEPSPVLDNQKIMQQTFSVEDFEKIGLRNDGATIDDESSDKDIGELELDPQATFNVQDRMQATLTDSNIEELEPDESSRSLVTESSTLKTVTEQLVETVDVEFEKPSLPPKPSRDKLSLDLTHKAAPAKVKGQSAVPLPSPQIALTKLKTPTASQKPQRSRNTQPPTKTAKPPQTNKAAPPAKSATSRTLPKSATFLRKILPPTPVKETPTPTPTAKQAPPTLLSVQKDTQQTKKRLESRRKQAAPLEQQLRHAQLVVSALGCVIRYLNEQLDAFGHTELLRKLEHSDKDKERIAESFRTREVSLMNRITQLEQREVELNEELVAWETEAEAQKKRQAKEREKLLEMQNVELQLIRKEYEKKMKLEKDGQAELFDKLDKVTSDLESAQSREQFLETRIKELENALKLDKANRVIALNDKIKQMTEEVQSLNVVLELKDEKLKQLQKQLMEKDLQADQQRPLRRENEVLQQKLEQVQISLQKKCEEIDALRNENIALRNSQENHSKEQKRLSLRNEELEFALSQSMSMSMSLSMSLGSNSELDSSSITLNNNSSSRDLDNTPIRIPPFNPFNFTPTLHDMSASCVELTGSRTSLLRQSRSRPCSADRDGPSSLPAVSEGQSSGEGRPRPVARRTYRRKTNDGTEVERGRSQSVAGHKTSEVKRDA